MPTTKPNNDKHPVPISIRLPLAAVYLLLYIMAVLGAKFVEAVTQQPLPYLVYALILIRGYLAILWRESYEEALIKDTLRHPPIGWRLVPSNPNEEFLREIQTTLDNAGIMTSDRQTLAFIYDVMMTHAPRHP